MSITQRAIDRILMLHHATATEVEQLRPRVVRVRLAGEEISTLAVEPGQHIRVRVIDDTVMSRDLLRTYTIVEINHDQQWLDLYIYQPSPRSTPGLDWSRSVAPGAAVSFMGPVGRFTVRPDASHHLVVGEETAEMAFAAILRAVPPQVPMAGVIEVSSPSERLDFPRAQELTWSYRGNRSASSSASLLNSVAALDLPATPGIAYLAGEAATVAAIRTHLTRDRGWPRRNVLTKPFWAPNRKGLD